MAQMAQEQMAQPNMNSQKSEPKKSGGRLHIFLHSVAFVLGFSIVFTLLGSAFGLLGQSADQYSNGVAGFSITEVLQRIGAILLVIFALTTLGTFRWLVDFIDQRADLGSNPAAAALVGVLNFFNSLLYTEKRVTEMHQVKKGWGYFSSVLLGFSFSAGWVPCVGPILASILFLAGGGSSSFIGGEADAGSPVMRGAILLLIYSLGLGIPFLITGAAFGTVSKGIRRLNRYANVVGIISGIFLFYVAYLLWSGTLAMLNSQFSFLNDWVFALEEQLSVATGTGGDVVDLGIMAAAPIAFFAGLISFLSPCVLPLVPAYVGYLSGAALGSAKD